LDVVGERILVVDDEPGVRTALEGVLSDEGYAVQLAETAEEALEILQRPQHDAVLLDVWLPGMDGIEALQKMREMPGDYEVVMISGHGNIETAVRATKLGAFDFVEKPLSLEKTLLVLRNALRQRRLERRNRRLIEQLDRQTEVVGSSRVAETVRRQIDMAASADAPVLLLGEPGSGREAAARRIHESGVSAEQPFVDVQCGAMAGPLLEEVLFGDGTREGRVSLAAGGTLFLGDVDRLDAAVQERVAARLGQLAESVPLRRMASACVAAELQEELRGRLGVIELEIPPLRSRKEDLPRIAERVLTDLAREYGRTAPLLSGAALAALQRHTWPGNVVEFRNLMERMLLAAGGDSIELDDLPQAMGGHGVSAVDLYGEFDSLAAGVDAFKQHLVQRVLIECSGSKAKAARRLGISSDEMKRMLVESGGD